MIVVFSAFLVRLFFMISEIGALLFVSISGNACSIKTIENNK